jgi:hypothetical protein
MLPNDSVSNSVRGLRAVLANPYGQTAYNAYSSHYIQGYMPVQAGASGWPLTTPEGYTLSSTYVPGNSRLDVHSSNATARNHPRDEREISNNRSSKSHPPSSSPHWYQAGDFKCGYKNCTFTGSQKSVETHRMDRHLIYPPGWDHRRRKPDWDTDHSLKGCV